MDEKKFTISADILYQIEHDISEFNNLHIGDEIKLSGPLPISTLKFSNCEFKQRIVIKSGQFPEGITFENCEFTKGVLFENTKVDTNSTKDNIHFMDCKNLAIKMIDVTAAGLLIERCQAAFAIMEDSNFKTVEHRGGSVDFIQLRKIKALEFTVASIEVKQEIIIDESMIDELNVLRVTGNPTLDIKEVKTKNLAVYECSLTRIKFTDVVGKQLFTRNDTISASNIEGEKEKTQQEHCFLEFRGNTFGKAFTIEGERLGATNAIIDCNDGLAGQLHFNKCNFNYLELTGTNIHGELIFTQATVSTVKMENFTNLGSVLFSACKVAGIDPRLIITHADLGKTKFLNHNFNDYQYVDISHSFISDILVTSCKWFTNDQLLCDESENNNGRREVYRQLKHASEKQGDRISALKFQAEELRAFDEEVSRTKDWQSADWWILQLSKTNEFGLQWGKALGWLLIWTIALFVPMAILASPGELLWKPAQTVEDVIVSLKVIWWDRLKIFIQLFNPAHNPLAFVDPKVSPLYFVLDGIHRIGAAFLIVQIVSAFRKYIKS